jgi:hypothetical protein
VAVVGGGPSGLTTAWRLAQKGHKVAVFEGKLSIGGGMLGGGMLGGGMILNEIVIQEEARPILEELNVRLRPVFGEYYIADALETITTMTSQTLKAGATVFNLISEGAASEKPAHYPVHPQRGHRRRALHVDGGGGKGDGGAHQGDLPRLFCGRHDGDGGVRHLPHGAHLRGHVHVRAAGRGTAPPTPNGLKGTHRGI